MQGVIGQAVANPSLSFTTTTATQPWQSYPEPINNKIHNFTCEQVENGWTLQYRSKQYIAADLDELMDRMKAAMVTERLKT